MVVWLRAAVLVIPLTTIFLNENAIAIEPDAETVFLKSDCTVGTTELNNCFEDLSAIDNWVNNIRTSSSVLVDVGPGIFEHETIGAAFDCDSANISIRGSGRTQTIINTPSGLSVVGILIGPGCSNLNVQDIKFVGGLIGGLVTNLSAVTSWTNVELVGGVYGWFEALATGAACPDHNGRHFWRASRIEGAATIPGAATSIVYTASCAESWFWSSQIVAKQKGDVGRDRYALLANDAEVHIYGSNVRLIVSAGVDAAGADLIRAQNGSTIHIHGTGLDVIHDGVGAASFLNADATSTIHANETAFSLSNTGGGTVSRIVGAGAISSPYAWSPRTQPPAISQTRDGADTYIETDCPQFGHCSTGGDFPHQMIYRQACAGGVSGGDPWYDTSTNACR